MPWCCSIPHPKGRGSKEGEALFLRPEEYRESCSLPGVRQRALGGSGGCEGAENMQDYGMGMDMGAHGLGSREKKRKTMNSKYDCVKVLDRTSRYRTWNKCRI